MLFMNVLIALLAVAPAIALPLKRVDNNPTTKSIKEGNLAPVEAGSSIDLATPALTKRGGAGAFLKLIKLGQKVHKVHRKAQDLHEQKKHAFPGLSIMSFFKNKFGKKHHRRDVISGSAATVTTAKPLHKSRKSAHKHTVSENAQLNKLLVEAEHIVNGLETQLDRPSTHFKELTNAKRLHKQRSSRKSIPAPQPAV